MLNSCLLVSIADRLSNQFDPEHLDPNRFKQFFQYYHQGVKRFGSKSGLMFRIKLVGKLIRAEIIGPTHVKMTLLPYTLTLKAPITTSAEGNFCNIFLIMPYLLFLKKEAKFEIVAAANYRWGFMG